MENIETGDIVVKKRWHGSERKIVNGFVGETHMLVGSYLWNSTDYKTQHCQVVPRKGWVKVTT